MVWTFSQQFGIQAMSFLVSIVMARVLSPVDFGLMGMIGVFVAIGVSLMNSGLTQSLIRTTNPGQDDYSTVFYFNLAGSILVYWLLFFTAPLVANFFSQPVLVLVIRVFCLSFIVSAFSEVQMARLTKEMNFKLQLLIAIPSMICSGLLGILLAYLGYGVWSLVWMSLCQTFLNTVQLWIRTGWKPSFIFDRNKFRYHFKFGYKLTLSGLLDTIFTNIYLVIIGRFFIPSEVGYFTRADSLRQLPVRNISTALNKISYPLFASIQDDNARLKSAYKKIMQMVIFIIAPLLILMGVLADPLFRFLFTEKWLPAVPYFRILCIAGILYPLHAYNLNILNVRGRSDLFLNLEIIKKLLIISMIAITIRFGIIALIWGQVISSILSFFINSYYSGKFLDYSAWQQVKDILPLLGLGLVAGIAVWMLDHQLEAYHIHDLGRLLIGILSGACLYLGAAYILKMDSLQELKRIILKR